MVETVHQKCAYLYSLYTGPEKLTVCYDEVIMLHSTDFKKTEFGAENDVAVDGRYYGCFLFLACTGS